MMIPSLHVILLSICSAWMLVKSYETKNVLFPVLGVSFGMVGLIACFSAGDYITVADNIQNISGTIVVVESIKEVNYDIGYMSWLFYAEIMFNAISLFLIGYKNVME